ncbi:MAG: hypothetical protein JWL90_2796 [Chthoniobacteraceae bacterium]|nr:hypothetical protein [Chthoniobacteraceae bacterium]
MLYALQADIPGPHHRTYAWCSSLSDKRYMCRRLPDGREELVGFPMTPQARFEGGRAWPDVSANGGGLPKLLFSQTAIDILRHYDPKAAVSEPAEVTYEANKSLSKKGPPVYRTFIPRTIVPRQKLAPDADRPAIFACSDYLFLLGCNEYVKMHFEKARLRNVQFTPFFEKLAVFDEMDGRDNRRK